MDKEKVKSVKDGLRSLRRKSFRKVLNWRLPAEKAYWSAESAEISPKSPAADTPKCRIYPIRRNARSPRFPRICRQNLPCSAGRIPIRSENSPVYPILPVRNRHPDEKSRVLKTKKFQLHFFLIYS